MEKFRVVNTFKRHIVKLTLSTIVCITALTIPSCSDTDGITFELAVTHYVPSLQESNDTEKDSRCTEGTVLLKTDETALVLIDMWNRDELKEAALYNIQPLISLAREKGITVIHAPSQIYDIHPLLKPAKGELVVTGYHQIDETLKLRGIKNILVGGFDAYKCVIDKPMGIFSTHFRDNNFTIIPVKNAVFSRNRYHHDYAIRLFQGRVGPVTSIRDLFTALQKKVPASVRDSIPVPPEIKDISPKAADTFHENSAVVLLNSGAMESHPNDGFRQRLQDNYRDNLLLLVEKLRNSGIEIIHMPGKYGHSSALTPVSDEKSFTTEKGFFSYVKKRNFHTLYYAGYDTNFDLLAGPAGIIKLYSKKRYFESRLPGYAVIRDCFAAFEAPESLAEELNKNISMLYRNTETISSDRIISILTGKHSF